MEEPDAVREARQRLLDAVLELDRVETEAGLNQQPREGAMLLDVVVLTEWHRAGTDPWEDTNAFTWYYVKPTRLSVVHSLCRQGVLLAEHRFFCDGDH